MTPLTLELLREEKVAALLKGGPTETRLEVSDVIVHGPYFYVVFDNLHQIGRLNRKLEAKNSALLGRPGADSGYEGLTYNPNARRFYILIECVEDKGQFKSRIEEYDEAFNLLESHWANFVFSNCNKGFEGIEHFTRGGEDYLLAICEGNKCRDGAVGRAPGKGRIKVLQKETTGWEKVATLKLPKTVLFEDFSGLGLRGNKVAVVSQTSSALWVGTLRRNAWEFVDDGQVYRFPRSKKGNIRYGNIEGVAWLDARTIAVVSDKMKKGEQNQRVEAVDQSIHIFALPPA